ncbi:hypothetical protein BaRGS_00031544 [Batillaria attramentaria]|uniref:Major facilitator superfamily (MFS) profile domain-containing protein n=1 Tax=Batillaria attramentaria TaxID=370345 RepID=A0ABD0JQ87_9CAEN
MEGEQTTAESEQATLNSTQARAVKGTQATGPPKWRSTRFQLSYLILCGFATILLQRVSFSMNIVCMVNHTALDQQDNSRHSTLTVSLLSTQNGDGLRNQNSSFADGEKFGLALSNSSADGPFVWNKEMQGIVLGSVYWGLMITQLFAAYVFYYAGPKLVCGVCMAVMSLLSMLCHPASYWSPWAVFVLRLGMGICSSFTIPSMYAIWGKWAPSGERSTLIIISFSGQHVANAIVFPLSALLCKYGFAGGWPSVFYVFGCLGLVWSVVWLVLVSDSPETHRRIHPDERDFIVNNRSAAFSRGDKVSVPWVKILTSLCFWALVAAHFAFTWGLYLFLSNLPLYMFEVMKFDIKSNGVYSMLPYVALWTSMVGGGFVSDCILRRKILSVFWSRRLFCAVSNIIPAVLLLVMSYLGCNHVGAVMTLLILALGFTGFAYSGFLPNAFDMAPKFAATIQSVDNSLACLPGIITPYLVAELTKEKTREQWQVVFFITAGVFVFGTVFFCIFAKTSVQSWALPAKTELVEIDAEDIGNTVTDETTSYKDVSQNHAETNLLAQEYKSDA